MNGRSYTYKIKDLFPKLLKFGITGMFGLVIDFLITWTFIDFLDSNIYLANASGFVVAASCNYYINKKWTFNSDNPEIIKQYVIFFSVSLIGLFLNTIFLYIFHHFLDTPFYISKMIAISIVFVWNFWANAAFTFKDNPTPTSTQTNLRGRIYRPLNLHNSFFAILINTGVLILVYIVFLYFDILKIAPSNVSLIQWDANWYNALKTMGYYYSEGSLNPMAFFPLFPLMWFLTGLDAIGISVLNYLLFACGFYFLAAHLRFDLKKSLLFISTPSLFFCFVPYSEAIFFLSSVILLIGLDKEKSSIIILGLLIAALSRSIGMVFIGAIILSWLVVGFANKAHLRHQIKRLIIYCSVIVGTTLLVFFIQYVFTGEWMVFFKVQNTWNRTLQLPTLPFTGLTGINILWLDGLALFVCILALLVFVCHCFSLLKATTTPFPNSVLFSITYLLIIGLISTFYSGEWYGNEGTVLLSINRFVFSTPFFIVFAYHIVCSTSKIKNGYLPIVFIGTMFITWILLGAYKMLPGHASYLVTLTYFLNMSLYVLAYSQIRKTFFIFLIYAINTPVQIILFYYFLNGVWVA